MSLVMGWGCGEGWGWEATEQGLCRRLGKDAGRVREAGRPAPRCLGQMLALLL